MDGDFHVAARQESPFSKSDSCRFLQGQHLAADAIDRHWPGLARHTFGDLPLRPAAPIFSQPDCE